MHSSSDPPSARVRIAARVWSLFMPVPKRTFSIHVVCNWASSCKCRRVIRDVFCNLVKEYDAVKLRNIVDAVAMITIA